MRLLLDANLSPRLVGLLTEAGFEAVHAGDLGLLTATDPIILERASRDGLVVVTADGDFPMLLALGGASAPSVVHLRNVAELKVEEHATLLLANLDAVEPDLERGAVVSLSPGRLAVRDLPIQ